MQLALGKASSSHNNFGILLVILEFIELSSFTNEDITLINEQLARVLLSPYFKSAGKQKSFLSFIVKKTLKGEGAQLKQYTIAVEGLDFPDDFDSDVNPVIRITAGRIRKRLDDYYSAEGKNDALQITIPKGSYSPNFHKVVKKLEKSAVKVYSEGPKIALACFMDKTQNEKSNQLLYYFADNLAENLSHFIFSKLFVSIPHGDKENSSTLELEMKEKYNADYTVVLYLQKFSKEQAQLLYRVLDTSTEEIIGSGRYDLPKKPTHQQQEDICGRIASIVADLEEGLVHVHWARKVLRMDPIPTEYNVLAHYRFHADDCIEGSFRPAVNACLSALENASDDIFANILLADYCHRDYIYGFGVIDEPLAKGKACAELAIRLKPDSNEAHYGLGEIFFSTRDWDKAIEQFAIAQQLNKYSGLINYASGYYLCLMNEWEKGLPLVTEAMQTNNYPDWYNVTPFLNEYRQNNYEQALKYAYKIIDPNSYWGPLSRAVTYGQLGNSEKAQSEIAELTKRFPSFLCEEEGQKMLSRTLAYASLAELVWEGLLKAGLTNLGMTNILKNCS